MIFEFPTHNGKKQVEKCDLFWGNLFWDNAPAISSKFKRHEYLENVNFEGTSNVISISIPFRC